jgi:hypothetical protein
MSGENEGVRDSRKFGFAKRFIFTDLELAERVGFEPTCRLPDKTLSRRPRYDHFGTSPGRVRAVCRTVRAVADAPTGNYTVRNGGSLEGVPHDDQRWHLVKGPYERGGGPGGRDGIGVAEPKTFIAVAIIPETSDKVAGTMTVFVCLARWPNCATYCSATRS